MQHAHTKKERAECQLNPKIVHPITYNIFFPRHAKLYERFEHETIASHSNIEQMDWIETILAFWANICITLARNLVWFGLVWRFLYNTHVCRMYVTWILTMLWYMCKLECVILNGVGNCSSAREKHKMIIITKMDGEWKIYTKSNKRGRKYSKQLFVLARTTTIATNRSL